MMLLLLPVGGKPELTVAVLEGQSFSNCAQQFWQ